MRAICFALIVVGCGTDSATHLSPDAPPPPPSDADSDAPPVAAAPRVLVTAPRANEAFYQTSVASVSWLVTDAVDPIVACEVVADAGGTPIALTMSPLMTTVGKELGIEWSLAAAPVAGYHITVTCKDSNLAAGTGTSDAFAVTSPPAQVSYATQIRPIFEASCASMMCHDAMMPAAGLDLSATSTPVAAMVGAMSRQCVATPLVVAGAPEDSYLVHKLQGSGPCFPRARMPKNAMALTDAEIQLVRDWIAIGAPDN